MRIIIDRLAWLAVIAAVSGAVYFTTALDTKTQADCWEAQVTGSHPQVCYTCRTGVRTIPASIRLSDARKAEARRRGVAPLPSD